MQIVIEISEEDYKKSNEIYRGLPKIVRDNEVILKAIANGIPLPPHGDLIDRDALIARGCYWETEYEMSKAPTILEAKGE